MANFYPKHVLILAYYFPPLGLSGVQRVAKLAKYLPENGWKVTVITPSPGAYFAFDESLLDELTANPGITIERTPSWDPTRIRPASEPRKVPFPEERSRKLFSLVSHWLLIPDNKIGWKKFAVKQAEQSHKNHPFDLVYATAPPYTCFLAGREVSQNLEIPLVIDYRDDWIENPRHHYSSPWHKRKNERLESAVVATSSRVLTINNRIADAVKMRNPAYSDKINIVPHGFDPEDFTVHDSSRPDSQEVRPDSESGRKGPVHDFGREDPPVKMTFLYAGMFYDAQQPDSFLEALKQLIERKPDISRRIRAQFAGLFPESKKKLIEEYGLESVVELTGYVDHTRTIELLQSCDVAWMIVGRQPGEDGISTGKLFEYMGSRKPILGLVPEGTAKETLSDYPGGYSVSPDNIAGISAHLEKLFSEWETGTLAWRVEGNLDPFNRKMQAKLIASYLDQVISKVDS